jgi:DNA-binding HxlR family transcriptional regulator
MPPPRTPRGARLRHRQHPRLLCARQALGRDDPELPRLTVTSFVGVRKAVSGISDTVLGERLLELTEAKRVTLAVAEAPSVSVGYELTTAGAELLPMIAQLGVWAQRNLAAPAK